MKNIPSAGAAFYIFSSTFFAASALHAQEKLLITPPALQTSICEQPNNAKRQESCQYGYCGTSCLEQGAFCCGPAGSLATSPMWVCDNGACITSVRGTTGIVDCYDPDNPSGTTQSCLDNQPTASCNPTDKCYTCEADQPYCRWETYIASNEPELRWFSCVETKMADLTFLAETITNAITSTTASTTASTTTSASTSTATAQAEDHNSSGLSIGATIGIAVAAGIVGLASVIGLVYWFLTKRKSKTHAAPAPPSELHEMASAAPLELESHQTQISQDQRYMELQGQKWGRLTSPAELTGYSRLQEKH